MRNGKDQGRQMLVEKMQIIEKSALKDTLPRKGDWNHDREGGRERGITGNTKRSKILSWLYILFGIQVRSADKKKEDWQVKSRDCPESGVSKARFASQLH